MIKKWQEENPGHWRKDTKEKEHIPDHYLSPTEVKRWGFRSPEAKEIEAYLATKDIDYKGPEVNYNTWFLYRLETKIGIRAMAPLNKFFPDEAGCTEENCVKCKTCKYYRVNEFGDQWCELDDDEMPVEADRWCDHYTE